MTGTSSSKKRFMLRELKLCWMWFYSIKGLAAPGRAARVLAVLRAAPLGEAPLFTVQHQACGQHLAYLSENCQH